MLAVLRDLRVLNFWLPENRRQVRQTIRNQSPYIGAMIFGFEMGTGVRTYITGTAPYLVSLAILLMSTGVTPGLFAGVGFGLSRGLVIVDRVLYSDREIWDQKMSKAKSWWPIFGLGYVTVLMGILIWSL